MSLVSATCPTHGIVKVSSGQPRCPRSGCMVICTPIPEPEPEYMRSGPAPIYDSDRDAPDAQPEPAPQPVAAIEPTRILDTSATTLREWREAHEQPLVLPPGPAGIAWLASTRALVADMESRITELKTRIKTDTAELAELEDAAFPIQRTLKRYASEPVVAVKIAAPVASRLRSANGKPWARDWPACRKCHRTDVRHAAHGFCYGCRPGGTAESVRKWEAEFEATEARELATREASLSSFETHVVQPVVDERPMVRLDDDDDREDIAEGGDLMMIGADGAMPQLDGEAERPAMKRVGMMKLRPSRG